MGPSFAPAPVLWRWAAIIVLLTLGLSSGGHAQTATGTPLQQPAATPGAAALTLVLKTPRRFASAGYHVAVAQGYFAAEGIEVRLADPAPGRHAIGALHGASVGTYAVAGPEAIVAAVGGQPLVLLAPIYRHADEALFTRADGGRRSPFDLRLARITADLSDPANIAVAAMLKAALGADGQPRRRQAADEVRALHAGHVDAVGGLASERLFGAPGRGADELFALRPRDWGLPAPGDGLYTTTAELTAHPARALAMQRAVVRGWMHALAHPDETLDLLMSLQDGSAAAHRMSREALAFEAQEVARLIDAGHVPMGQQAPARVQSFVRALSGLGLSDRAELPAGFFHDALRRDAASAPPASWWQSQEAPAAILLTLASLLLLGALLLPVWWPGQAGDQFLSRHFGTWRLATLVIATGVLLATAAAVQVQRTLDNDLANSLRDVRARLGDRLDATRTSLGIWADDRIAQLRRSAADPALQALAERLSQSGDAALALRGERVQSLLTYLDDLAGTATAEDVFLIDPVGVTLAARDRAIVGQPHTLKQARPDLLARAVNGFPVFIPPGSMGPTSQAFFVVPVHNRDRRVIALFTQRRASETRVDTILDSPLYRGQVEVTLVSPPGGAAAPPHARAGSEPVDGDTQSRPVRDLLARAARPPLPVVLDDTGAFGEDMSGTVGHHGGRVLSMWAWERDLGVGLIARIDLDAALADHGRLARTLWTAFAAMLALGAALLLLLLHLGRRAALQLRQAHSEQVAIADQLETMNDDREAAELRHRTVLDNLVDPVITIDETGIVRSFSLAAERAFGHSADAVIGNNVKMLMPSNVAAHHDGFLQRYLDTGERRIIGIGREVTAKRADGSEFPAELSVAEVRVRGQRLYTGMIRDITDKRAAALALAQAKEDADSANHAKSVFLANMSHEIRTPLNAVLGYAQLLERDHSLSDDHRKIMHTINRSGEHLLQLINDVLDMSKIEAGRMELTLSPCHLGDMLGDVVRLFEMRAAQKGLQLTLERDPTLPAQVVADGRKLRQILINLVGNAMKFTSAGSITLRASVLGRSDEGSRLEFEVADTGPGIAAADQQRIFAPFGQTEVGAASGGTGLGLTICRRMVELMGGELAVDSVVGEGSRFHFVLTVDPCETNAPGSAPIAEQVTGLAPGQGDVDVLVVDDHEDNRDLLRHVLRRWGFTVREAADGDEAVERCKERCPDLVLMDVVMVRMNGIDATRQILGLRADGAPVILGIIASALDTQVQDLLDAGARAVLTKPVQLQALAQAIEAHAGLRFERGRSTVATEPQAAAPQEPRALDWGRLPQELRLQLLRAAELGDTTSLRELTSQAADSDADIAAAIRVLHQSYDFAALIECLRQDPGIPPR